MLLYSTNFYKVLSFFYLLTYYENVYNILIALLYVEMLAKVLGKSLRNCCFHKISIYSFRKLHCPKAKIEKFNNIDFDVDVQYGSLLNISL